jgi:hypothetical protein
VNRQLCSALLVAYSLAASASAGVIGQANVVTSFSTPDSALTGHTGYALSIATDDGSLISAVDVSIIGRLHQRWGIDPDTGDVLPSPRGASLTNGDSHLMLSPNSLFVLSSDEDNTGAGSPLPDTDFRDYGYGTFLRGLWGIPAANQTNAMNLAYIVIPNDAYEDLAIVASVATTNGAFQLGRTNFGWSTPSPRILASNPIPDNDRSTIEINFGTSLPAEGLVRFPRSIQLWNAGEGVINVISTSLSGSPTGSFGTGGNGVRTLIGGATGANIDIYFFASQGYGRGVLQIKTDAGDLNFDIAAGIPEPSTLLLASIALIPLTRRIRLFTLARKAYR